VAAISRGTQVASDDPRESVSQMFAEVWHDLNQTLHLMRMSLTPLLDLPDVKVSPGLSECARLVRQSCETLEDLLAEALDLSRLESHAVAPRLQRMAVLPLVRSVVEHFSTRAEVAGVRLMVAAPGDDCSVIADDLMFHRVLANLLDNSIAHSMPGQTVLLAVRYSREHCKLQIRDAGHGISGVEHGRVFDAYVRLAADRHGHVKGFGLGLAIVKRLVLLMSGTVLLRSAPNQGCCVTVRLPRANRFRPPSN
jgi:signal transduction histidine kinase